MRSYLCAVLALAMLVAPGVTVAQSAGDVSGSAAGLPKAPVPYTVLNPRKKPAPKARPRPAAASPAPARAGAVGLMSAAPVVAAASTVAAQPAPRPAPGPQAALPEPSAMAAPAVGQVMSPQALEAFVDGVVKEAMARDHIAGVAVSVVQNGQIVLKKGYGFAGLNPRRPVDPDTSLFRLGSISKTFTWIALMKEVEAGRIRLDRPVNLYLPERVQVRDQGFSSPVTVAQLMDHSAGFEDRALGHLFERDARRVRPLLDYLRQERPKRVRPPGQAVSYSNYGAALAGQAVAYVNGKTFERLLEEDIFIPAGMARTTFRESRQERPGLPGSMPAALRAGVVEGYRWTPTGFAKRDYELIGQIAPAGSASSTATDMARYMALLLNGGTLGETAIYGPRTAQAFRTPLRATPTGINGWAHGMAVYDLPGGHRGYGHSGQTLSFRSNMVTVPDLNLGIFIATNTESGQALSTRLPDLVVRQFYGAPQAFPRLGSRALARDAEAFAGYYVSDRRAYSGLEGFVTRLKAGSTVTVTPDGRLVTTGDQLRTWTPDGEILDGNFIAVSGDERLAFTLRNGMAQSFQTASGDAVYQRAPFWRRPQTLGGLAALAVFAAFGTLVGTASRSRREARENQIQRQAGLVQNMQACLWLIAVTLFAIWASKSGDIAQVMYGWPGPLLITSSACALVAAALTFVTIAALPAVWSGGRRVDSWTSLRKLFFTGTVLIYSAFIVLLAMSGALSPWSG